MPDGTRSHYDRLGGAEAIRAAVDKLYVRILGDDHLAPYFAGVDVARIKRHQVLFLCALLGGPQNYDDRPFYEAHRGLGITPADYDRVIDHLEDVLVAAGAPEGTVVAVSDALVGAKPEIVEVPRDP